MPDSVNELPFMHNELDFCDLISDIGLHNQDNITWWSSSISTKNFGTSSLWKRLQSFLTDGQTFKGDSGLVSLIKNTTEWIYRTRLLAPAKLRFSIRGWLKSNQGNIDHLFFTHFQMGSFDWKINKYNDRYWGPLLEYLDKRNETYVLVGFNVGDERIITRFILNDTTNNIRLFPVEAFINLSDILRAIQLCIFRSPLLPSSIQFLGKNISPILMEQYKNELCTGEILKNASLYYAFKRILNDISPDRIYWPWENHAWEHLLCLAAKQYAPNIRRIGFQHTTIPPYLLNHFPGKGEWDYAPGPHRIITVGNGAAHILRTYGHIPDNVLLEGCALRHKYLFTKVQNVRTLRKMKAIGVALSISQELSISMIDLIKKSSFAKGLDIILRVHPASNSDFVQPAISGYPNICCDSSDTINSFIDSCDIFAYSDSTVCLEALFIGIPVICIESDIIYKMDPLFELDSFKWSASSHEGLDLVFKYIINLPDNEYFKLQNNAIQYVRSYFNEPTEERLKIFLNA